VDSEDETVSVDCGDDVESVEGREIGGDGGDGGRGISKISTTSEDPLELTPPPKNILFVDDADAST
jgi:hypothetical protein